MDREELFAKEPFRFIFSLISCVLWGSAFPVLKISYAELNFAAGDVLGRVALGGIRFFLASILLFLFTLFIEKQSLKIGRKNILILAVLGIFQTGVMYILFYNGVANTTGMKSSIIAALETFFTILLAHWVYENDKIDKNKAIGIVLGFTGIVLSNWGQGFSGDFSFWGEGLLMISSVIGAVSSIFVKKLSESIHPFVLTSYQMFFGAILMLIISFGRITREGLSFTPLAGGLLIYSVFLSAISFALWYMLLKYNKAGEISIFRFIIPVSGAVLSALFIPGEKLTFMLIMALLLVSLGIIAVNRQNNKG
ncbi:DMT family transporter [Clostridium polynesiense]|uniref:DMT family transporter n=1 Tax=Clostridium polynesiense TaxID=1325933 RepID=UPI00059011EF|nr:DMT family transporter [Clostridium polynesiense]